MPLEVIVWKRSSRSDSAGGNCVEVGMLGRQIAIRDSKQTDAGGLVAEPDDWKALLTALL